MTNEKMITRNMVVVNVAHKVAAIMTVEFNKLAPHYDLMFEISVRPTEYVRMLARSKDNKTSVMFDVQLLLDMGANADTHIRAKTRQTIKELMDAKSTT